MRFRDLPELELLSDIKARRFEADLQFEPILALLNGDDLEADWANLSDYLLPAKSRVNTDRLAALVDDAQGEERRRRMLLVLFSLPEFQTC